MRDWSCTARSEIEFRTVGAKIPIHYIFSQLGIECNSAAPREPFISGQFNELTRACWILFRVTRCMPDDLTPQPNFHDLLKFRQQNITDRLRV